MFTRPNHSQTPKLLENVNDADGLFRKHTVAEIRGKDEQIKYVKGVETLANTQKRHEIDAKKQDLRMMVGERYRDLIDAADSIAEMKKAAQTIVSTLQTMQDACHVGENQREKKMDDNTEWLYPVTAQIKLLIDTPEQIYHALEKQEFHRAAQIYVLAQNINQNLLELKVAARFPVAQKQWDAVNPLKEQILQRAITHQRLTHHTAASQANACKARSLLEQLNASASFGKFLDMRTQLLVDLLDQAQDGLLDSSSLSEIINTLYATVRQAQGVISGINQADDAQNVSQLFPAKANLNLLLHHLPADSANWIQDEDRGDISPEQQKSVLSQWVRQTHSRLAAGLGNVLNQVSLARQLWDLRVHVFKGMEQEEMETETKSSWGATCQNVLSSTVSVRDIVQSAFEERAKAIVAAQFEDVHAQPRLALQQELKNLESASPFQSVRDVAWLLWNPTDSDVANEFELDTLVSRVLKQFLSSLASVREDLECLHESMPKVLEQASQDALNQFARGLQDLLAQVQFGSTLKDAWLGVDCALAIARVARSVALRLDSLVLFQEVKLGKRDKNVALHALQQQFGQVAQACHQPWISRVAPLVGRRLKQALMSVDWNDPKALREAWEAVAIKGTDDTGTAIEDKQFLPVQLTPALMQVVFSLCRELNRAFAHTMDKATLQVLQHALEREIYQTWAEFQASVSPSEVASMQLLFDFTFFLKLIPSKQTKTALWLKSLVDPIELKLSETGLMANVDRFYLRTSVLLGALMVLNPKPVEGKKNPSLQELHNTLALAPQAPRFSLLPVVGTTKKPIRDVSLTSMPSRAKKSSRRPRATGQLRLTEGSSVSLQEKETVQDFGSMVGQGITQRLETIGGGMSSLLGFLANPTNQPQATGRSTSPTRATDIPFFM